MDLVTVNNGTAVTTSMIVAEYFGKQHKDVLKAIRNLMNKDTYGTHTFFAQCWKINELANGRKEPFFEIDRDGFTLLAMGFTGKQALQFKLSYIDAFNKAESHIKNLSAPASPELQLAHAMLLAGNMIEAQKIQIEQRDKLISVAAPKAAALDRLSLADGSLCMTDAAKTLGIQPQKTFIPYLRANGWIYNRPGCAHPIAYQDKLQQMLLEHKTTTVNRTDGSEKITEQVRVTAKGLAKLAQIFGSTELMAA